MKPYPLCMILLFLCGMAFGQTEQKTTGIFLTIDCSRKVPRHNVMLTNRTVCLARNPIITPADFESVGDVGVTNKIVYFELTFRPKARERLAMLTANLPGSTLALVVESEVFFVFSADELKVLRTFRFQGNVEDVAAFHRVNATLRQMIAAN